MAILTHQRFCLVFAVIFLSSVICIACETCNPTGTTLHTKTSYDLVGNKDLNVQKPDNSCVPIQINSVHRHGHRYPGSSGIRSLKKLAQKLATKADTLKRRFNISFPLSEAFTEFAEDQSMLLTHVGEDETYNIGERIKARFPDVFSKPYSPVHYKVRSTCRLRCVRTANSLAYGFFEGTGHLGEYKHQPVAVETRDCYRDEILRPYARCDAWESQIERNRHVALKEYYYFKYGKVIKALIEKINKKIGFSHHNALGWTEIKRLFEACSYHINMYHGTLKSSICQLLDKDDIAAIEYNYELDFFYSFSYGHTISYQIACPLLRDIYQTVENAKNEVRGAYSGVFRVGHQETLVPLLTLMNVYVKKGEMLRASNFEEMKRNRTFHAACMASFSANVYFTLYKCAGNDYKIQMYVNEHLVKIPCCKSAVDCPVDVFLKCYKDIVQRCNFDKMCGNR